MFTFPLVNPDFTYFVFCACAQPNITKNLNLLVTGFWWIFGDWNTPASNTSKMRAPSTSSVKLTGLPRVSYSFICCRMSPSRRHSGFSGSSSCCKSFFDHACTQKVLSFGVTKFINNVLKLSSNSRSMWWFEAPVQTPF